MTTSAPKAVKLIPTYDPQRLQQDLDTVIRRFRSAPQVGAYHDGSWKGISLRSVDGDYRNSLAHSYGVCHDTEVLEHTPYIEEILASFKFKVGVARLLFLPPGKKIGEHTDSGHGWHLGLARLHIPIVTHENVIMMIDGERCQWREGEFWFGDFRLPHWLHNQSEITRVHLVIDCFVDEELLKLFPQEAVDAINATTDIFLNTPQDSNTQTHSINAYFKLASGFLPLYGRIISEREILKINLLGLPLPFGFTPVGNNAFRLRNKTLTLSADHQSASLVDDQKKLNVNLKLFSRLNHVQALYARIQTSTLSGGTALTLWLSRGVRLWKRATNSV